MESLVKTSIVPTIEGLKDEIESENGPRKSEEKRKRASRACLNCNRKKIKCVFVAGIEKCKLCLDGGIDCEFRIGNKRGPQRKVTSIDAFGSLNGSTSADSSNLNEISSSYSNNNSSSSNQCESMATISSVDQILQVKTPLLFTPRSYVGINMAHLDSSNVKSRYEDIENWKHMDFYMSQIPEKKGGSLAFLDYYFKYVYIDLPLLSKNCLEGHLIDLPLWLLHAMFACCFISPTASSVPEGAMKHMKYAIKCIYIDLEKADPFYCCALVHAAAFYERLHNESWITHVTLAVQICYQLGMDRDVDIVWTSHTGKVLQSIDLCRGIWIMVFLLDFYTQFSCKKPMIIKGSLAPSIVAKYVPVNSDHPTNIPENLLTYFKFQLPLVELSKRKLVLESQSEYLSSDTAEMLLEELNAWFNIELPSSFRYSKYDTIWKSRFTCMLNLFYFNNRLDILRPFFITWCESWISLNTVGVPYYNQEKAIMHFKDMWDAVTIVTVICRSFLDYKANGGVDEPFRHNDILKNTVFMSMLVLGCMVMLRRRNIVSDFEFESAEKLQERIMDHLRLLSIIDIVPLHEEIVQSILKDPTTALSYLKQF